VAGGEYKMARQRTFQCRDCQHRWDVPYGTGRPTACPGCGGTQFCRVDGEGAGRGQRGSGRRGGRRHGGAATDARPVAGSPPRDAAPPGTPGQPRGTLARRDGEDTER
jgi:hypothetical protein